MAHWSSVMALFVPLFLAAIVPWDVVSGCFSGNAIDLIDPAGGHIDSGGYLSDSDCKWLISASQDTTWVNLNFSFFSTQSLSDWVTVYDGPTIFDNVIFRHSGGALPPNPFVQSSGRQMLIRLTSDGSVNNAGFKADFSFSDPCKSADLAIGMATRNITYRKSVSSDQSMTCVWNIFGAQNAFVHLFLISLQLASSDVLDVYNGLYADSGAQLLQHISSNQIPAQSPIVANSGKMSLVLTHVSGGSYSPQISIFRATYQAGSCCGRVNVLGNQGVLTDGASDNKPYPIQQNGVCQWLIRAPELEPIALSFNNFDLASGGIIRVFDGSFSNGLSPLLASWTSDSPPVANSQPVLYSNGPMLIEFGSGTTNNVHTGFDVNYSVADSCATPFILSQPWGEFSHSPKLTSTKLNCTWIIRGGSLPVQLIFSSLDMPVASETIEIYDGDSPNVKWRILGNFDAYPAPIISTSTFLRVVLRGDSFTSYSSFTAIYNTALCRRQVNIKSDEGQFTAVTSTFYPDSSDCSFLITPEKSEHPISLAFSQFHTEEGKDVLFVYDGPYAVPSKLMLSWSGSTLPPRIYSTQPSMLVRLVTDASGSVGPGFIADFKTNFPPEPLSAELYFVRDLNKFHFSWKAPDSDATVLNYELQFDSDDGEGWQDSVMVSNSQFTYDDIDWKVVSGRYYAARVRAIGDSNVPGPWAVARYLLQGAPDVPGIFYAYGTSVNSIALEISLPPNGYSPLLSYTIEIYDPETRTYSELITEPYIRNTINDAHGNISSFSKISIDGLSPSTDYRFRMSSKNALGQSAFLEMSASTNMLSFMTMFELYATALIPIFSAVLVVVMILCTLMGVVMIYLSYKFIMKPLQMQAHMQLSDHPPSNAANPSSAIRQQDVTVDDEDIHAEL